MVYKSQPSARLLRNAIERPSGDQLGDIPFSAEINSMCDTVIPWPVSDTSQ